MGVKGLTEESVESFLEALASSAPTPGGGSVAALCGAMSAALSSMVCNLTIGKRKFADQEEAMEEVLEKASALQSRLQELVDEDAAAFDGVMAAFRMPKETEDEKAARSEAIQKALRSAAEVPLEVMERSLEAAKLAVETAKKGNPNAASDAGMAALMATAAVRGGSLNVLINLGSIKDEAYVAGKRDRLREIEAEMEALEQKTLEVVLESI